MKGIVQHHQDTKVIPLGGGTDRRILSYDDSLMAVEVSFETGSEGAPHTHPNTLAPLRRAVARTLRQ